MVRAPDSVLRSPRVWLTTAGGWLVLAGLAHAARHVWAYALGRGMEGRAGFARQAMEQAISPDPLRPSLWNVFRAFSASFGLLLLFAGALTLLLTWSGVERRTLRTLALFSTLFWTLAFVPYAFLDPVVQPLVVALVAVPLYGIAYLTASEEG